MTAIKTPTPSEHIEQVSVCRWLKKRGIDFFAVPNGAHLTGGSRAASKLKAEGMTPGVADLLITTPPPYDITTIVVALEMKSRAPSAKLSPAQKAWRDRYAQKAGWLYTVAYGAEDAIEQLRGLGYDDIE